MATHSRLSTLVGWLLLSTLLLSLFSSRCNATSRGMMTTAAVDPMATSCRGRDCPATTMEQTDQQGMMMRPKWAQLSSMDPAAATEEAEASHQWMTDRDQSQWVRGAESNSMMDTERLRDPDMVRESRTTLQNSENMRSNWMGESAVDRQMNFNERMRDPADKMISGSDHESTRDGSDMGSMRGTDSECMRNSESKKCMASNQRMRDSDAMMTGMGDFDGMRDSDRMRDLQGMIHSNRMRNSESTMSNSADRMRDSHDQIDSQNMNERMRDTHKMIDSGRMGDSHSMTESNTIRGSKNEMYSQKRSTDLEGAAQNWDDSNMMGDSMKGMRAMEGRRDLENAREAQNMMESAAAEQQITHLAEERKRGSQMAGDAKRINNLSNRRGDLEQWRDMQTGAAEQMTTKSHDGWSHSDAAQSRMGHMDSQQQTSEMQQDSCRGAHCRSTSDMIGDADQMSRSDFRRKGDLESSPRDAANMRNSDGMLQASEQMSTNSHNMRMSASADGSRIGLRDMETQQSSPMNFPCHGARHGVECRSSDLMGDAQPMNGLNRRGDLEMGRDMDAMRNSDSMHQGSDRMAMTNSQKMANSAAADQSKISRMEMQQQATMDPRSCHGTHCDGTSDEATMRQTSRHLNAEMIDSQSKQDSERIDTSSIAGKRCSEMNAAAADCDSAQMDGALRGPQNMDHLSEQDHVSSNACRLNGAACHVNPAAAEELQASQEVDHMTQNEAADQLSNACRHNGADCHMTTDQETSNIQSAKSGRMAACSDDLCRHTIPDSDQETMAGMANSNRMHRTRNDREIIATSPKWVKVATTADARRMDNPQETSPMMAAQQAMTAPHNSQKMRSTDAGTIQLANRDRQLGAIDDAERRSSRMQQSEMAPRMTHDSTSDQWTNAAQITHPSSCKNGAKCQRTSGIMHMNLRDSQTMGLQGDADIANAGSQKHLENQDLSAMDQMSTSAEARSTSNEMRNLDETNADNLPIHGWNY